MARNDQPNAGGDVGNGRSVGHPQLICFARAPLTNPRLLILDEATGSLDARTGVLVAPLHGHTGFVVVHQLSTIRYTNLGLVLDGGWIVEPGVHVGRLSLNGRYAAPRRQFALGGERRS